MGSRGWSLENGAVFFNYHRDDGEGTYELVAKYKRPMKKLFQEFAQKAIEGDFDIDFKESFVIEFFRTNKNGDFVYLGSD